MGRTAVGRILFFPLLLIYLELVLHLYMGMTLRYLPVWSLFSLAGGLLMTALTMPFECRVNCILAKAIASVVTGLYVIEAVGKKLLAGRGPSSLLGMAAEGRLTDCSDAVASAVIGSIPIISVMLLPAVLLFVFGDRVFVFHRADIRVTALTAALVAVLHTVGLLTLYLPWKGDLSPAQLYKTDADLSGQVEQLGLLTMLRMDLVHQVIPPGEDPGPLPASSPARLPSTHLPA